MTVEQEIRAAAVQAAVTIVASEPDLYTGDSIIKMAQAYENYIRYGSWSKE